MHGHCKGYGEVPERDGEASNRQPRGELRASEGSDRRDDDGDDEQDGHVSDTS